MNTDNTLENQLVINADMIKRYDYRVPRYTSYPTVPHWNGEYKAEDHIHALKNIDNNSPLSLYIHIPFCKRKCLFCACTTIITRQEDKVERYLKYLQMEIEKTAEYISSDNIIQLHFGGGTPTHLTPEQMDQLLGTIHDNFKFNKDTESSLELHPSFANHDHIDILARYNFNRLSVGVQDFDTNVQKKLNRLQTYEETVEIIDYARSRGIDSINTDLIYGLAYQSIDGLTDTIDKIIEIKPERIALYSFAFFPDVFPNHASIPLEVVPSGGEKLDAFLVSRELLLKNGYKQVGFDHFALPEDDLWTSYQNGTLRRNFMGYTTKAGTDLIGFGYSSISELGGSYAQNSKDMNQYELLIEKYGTATVKGHKLSDDDIVRKNLIMKFMCQNRISGDEYSGLRSDKIDKSFENFKREGLIGKNNDEWESTETGKIFSRVLASVFDAYYDVGDSIFSNAV